MRATACPREHDQCHEGAADKPSAMTSSDTPPALGLKSGTTVVRQYDPRWATEFEHEASVLSRLLGQLAVGI